MGVPSSTRGLIEDGVIEQGFERDILVARPESRHRLRLRYAAALLIVDMLAITLGFETVVLGYFGRVFDGPATAFVAVLLPIYFLAMLNTRGYGAEALTRRWRLLQPPLIALVVSAMLVLGIAFYLQFSLALSRVVTTAGVAVAGALLVVGRAAVYASARRRFGDGVYSEILICDGVPVPPHHVGPVIDAAEAGLAPTLDDPHMLDRIARIVGHMDRVILACHADRRADWAFALKGANIEVEVLAPELDSLGVLGARLHDGAAILQIATGPLTLRARAVKRGFDLVVVALVALPLFLVCLTFAVLIKLDSRGPVFFKQDRIGRGNRLFKLYKFRSMRVGQLDATASRLTARDDDRVTRLGNFMRRTSIDELPQLLNVLRGEMSIVGPRPHATGALAGTALYWEVDTRYWQRHAIKPGMTGLAQVRGFRGTTFHPSDLSDRLQADLEYIAGWSVWRDAAIVLHTFRVLVHQNAF